EVVVDGRRLDLRLVGDVAQPRARVPFPAEHVRGGIEDPLPGPRGLVSGVLQRRHLRFSRHESNYRRPAFPALRTSCPPPRACPALLMLQPGTGHSPQITANGLADLADAVWKQAFTQK